MAYEVTPAMAGCWLAGASNRSADELNHAVIVAARGYGFTPEAWAEDLDRMELWDGSWLANPEDSDACRELATEAEDYLNGLAPDGYAFGFDDGFYLLPLCQWEWFEPNSEECAHCAKSE